MESGLTDRISLSRTNIWRYNILTSPAVPHGHFAHPGLSDGGTGYCVLGWFLYNVPRSGLQTPLIATGFVSPGAGSPFAPLAHLAALCRDTENSDVQWNHSRVPFRGNPKTPGQDLIQGEGALLGCYNLFVCGLSWTACSLGSTEKL